MVPIFRIISLRSHLIGIRYLSVPRTLSFSCPGSHDSLLHFSLLSLVSLSSCRHSCGAAYWSIFSLFVHCSMQGVFITVIHPILSRARSTWGKGECTSSLPIYLNLELGFVHAQSSKDAISSSFFRFVLNSYCTFYPPSIGDFGSKTRHVSHFLPIPIRVSLSFQILLSPLPLERRQEKEIRYKRPGLWHTIVHDSDSGWLLSPLPHFMKSAYFD